MARRRVRAGARGGRRRATRGSTPRPPPRPRAATAWWRCRTSSARRRPLFDPAARGVFFGLTLAHRRGHLHRALLEGVAYGFRHHVEVLEAGGHRIDGVCASWTAGARSALWRQIVADVLGRAVAYAPGADLGSAHGVARVAGVAAGFWGWEGWAPRGGRAVVHEPAAASAGQVSRGLRRLSGSLHPSRAGLRRRDAARPSRRTGGGWRRPMSEWGWELSSVSGREVARWTVTGCDGRGEDAALTCDVRLEGQYYGEALGAQSLGDVPDFALVLRGLDLRRARARSARRVPGRVAGLAARRARRSARGLHVPGMGALFDQHGRVEQALCWVAHRPRRARRGGRPARQLAARGPRRAGVRADGERSGRRGRRAPRRARAARRHHRGERPPGVRRDARSWPRSSGIRPGTSLTYTLRRGGRAGGLDFPRAPHARRFRVVAGRRHAARAARAGARRAGLRPPPGHAREPPVPRVLSRHRDDQPDLQRPRDHPPLHAPAPRALGVHARAPAAPGADVPRAPAPMDRWPLGSSRCRMPCPRGSRCGSSSTSRASPRRSARSSRAMPGSPRSR